MHYSRVSDIYIAMYIHIFVEAVLFSAPLMLTLREAGSCSCASALASSAVCSIGVAPLVRRSSVGPLWQSSQSVCQRCKDTRRVGVERRGSDCEKKNMLLGDLRKTIEPKENIEFFALFLATKPNPIRTNP